MLGSNEVSLGTAILVGSTTTALAAHSTCPVVAWRGDAITPTKQPIVLGAGHDHDNEVAITAGFEFAHRFGQESLQLTHGRHGDQQAMSRFRS